MRYSASVAPIVIRQCWRRDCQYWAAGSASVNLVFPADQLTFTGPLAKFVSQADSGNRMTRGFCATCGTPVTSASEARPEFVILRAGTLDDTSIARPSLSIWTESAPPWTHHTTPRFPRHHASRRRCPAEPRHTLTSHAREG